MANVSEELARLAQLREQGVLTDAEFEAQKAAVLHGNIQAAPEAKKGKLGKGCLIAIVVIVALIVIGALASGGDKAGEVVPSSGQTASDATSNEPELTMAGYNQIRNGMTFGQVTAIIGKPSQEMSRNEIAGTETVMYMWEGSLGANMNAMFQNGKLVQKAQFGLR